MLPADIINKARENLDREIPSELVLTYKFESVDNCGIKEDRNLEFRTEIVNALLPDFSCNDIHLIRSLLEEDVKCHYGINRHDNFYQLCYYLYELGQLEDIFTIYNLKYNSGNFDISLMLDRSLLYMNHDIDEVIAFVSDRLQQDPDLNIQYPGILKELIELKENPDYFTVNDYSFFIRRYFKG